MFYSFPLNTRQIILLFVKETRYTYFVYNQSANVLRRNALSIRIIRAPINRAWQTRAHCCGHIVAHDVCWARKRAGHKMNVVFPCCANWETFVADTKCF